MENKLTPYFLSFFLMLSLTSILSAQSLEEIDTIYVQTTRIPLKASETGRNISVIEGQDIQKMAVTSLDDLFRYIPGLEVQSRNAFGAQGDITMRGATFSQVLVLVDGMKLNDPLTAHFNSYIPVTPAEIDRIEVLRGAASALYGADAVGGVINIITKGYNNSQEAENRAEGQVNYGQHRLVNTQQGFSIRKDRLYAGGGFSMNQSDGEFIPEKVLEDATLEGYNNFFDIKTFGLSLGYQLNDKWRLQARTAYDSRNFSARYFYTTSPADKAVETARNWWNQISLSKTGLNSSTEFKLSYRNGTDRFVFSPDFPSTNLHATQFWNANVNHLRIINDDLSINVGGQLDRRDIESTDRGDHNDWHYGLYAMGVFRPGKALSLTTSLRLDHDDNYGLEFTPQLNVSYVLSALTFRASAGRSIRAADYTERYVSYKLENLTPGRNLGNPALAAERSWSEEIGLDYRPVKNWQLKATAFSRQSSNLIDYVLTNERDIANNQNLQAGADYLYATNIANVQTQGVELESWLSRPLGKQGRMSWSLGYTYLSTSNDDEVASVYLSSHARHLISTNLILETGKIELALNGLYKQRAGRLASAIDTRLDPDYQVWNIRLGYQLTAQFGLNLQVHNFFDEDYQDILGAPMPGRWVMGGLRFGL
ncbi:MAG: TonB-dependent receptor [Lewinellaceae bacterium]|nr:TonB-dependent receptor [Lewinellaceae bacterium]